MKMNMVIKLNENGKAYYTNLISKKEKELKMLHDLNENHSVDNIHVIKCTEQSIKRYYKILNGEYILSADRDETGLLEILFRNNLIDSLLSD